LLGLARARFVAGDAGGALAAIQSLRAANPEHHKPDTDLLFARALEATGRTEEALAAYAALADAYPGEEARARYAALLAKLGQVQESRQEYAEIIRRVDLQGPHYKKMQRPWYDAARSAAAP
jgi:hypothetical protein